MTVRILIADDHKLVRAGLAMLIGEIPGYEVIAQADDGVSALESAIGLKPDVVLVDINMPRMTGLELIRQIRYLNAEIPILALTTESEQRIREQGKIAGVDGWIVKPFRPAQFLDIVKQISG